MGKEMARKKVRKITDFCVFAKLRSNYSINDEYTINIAYKVLFLTVFLYSPPPLICSKIAKMLRGMPCGQLVDPPPLHGLGLQKTNWQSP